MPDFAEPVTGLMVSVPERGRRWPQRLHLRSGRLAQRPVAPTRCWSARPSPRPTTLRSGDRFDAILNGRRQALTLVGTALSPEYIQQMRPGSVFPDPKRFGVMWMGRRALAQAYDMEGAFNDVAPEPATWCRQPGRDRRVDELLKPYGGLGAYARKDQLSHRFLSQELDQLGTLASLFPVMFMARGGLSAQRGDRAAGGHAARADRHPQGLWLQQPGGAAALPASGCLVIVCLGMVAASRWACGWASCWPTSTRSSTTSPICCSACRPDGAGGRSGQPAGGRCGHACLPSGAPPACARRRQCARSRRRAFARSWLEQLGLKRWLSQPTRMILRNLQRRALKSIAVGARHRTGLRHHHHRPVPARYRRLHGQRAVRHGPA